MSSIPRAIVPLAACAVIAVACALWTRESSSGDADSNRGDGAIATAADSDRSPEETESRDESEGAASGDAKDSVGTRFRALLPDGADPRTTAQVELVFVRLRDDGTTEPVEVDSFELVRADLKWATAYEVRAPRLRLAVGAEQDYLQLVSGAEYFVRWAGKERAFRVPESEPGQATPVEVIIGPPVPVPKPPERKMLTLEVRFAPDGGVSDATYVTYRPPAAPTTPGDAGEATTRDRTTGGNVRGDVCRLEIEQLGGDLLVGDPASASTVALFYVAGVDKLSLELPKDATLRPDPEQAVDPCRVSWRQDDLPDRGRMVAFYHSRTARLPVFWLLANEEVSVEGSVLIGAWWPRILVKKGSGVLEVAMAQVNVDASSRTLRLTPLD